MNLNVLNFSFNVWPSSSFEETLLSFLTGCLCTAGVYSLNQSFFLPLHPFPFFFPKLAEIPFVFSGTDNHLIKLIFFQAEVAISAIKDGISEEILFNYVFPPGLGKVLKGK